jgi:hypothetical protein
MPNTTHKPDTATDPNLTKSVMQSIHQRLLQHAADNPVVNPRPATPLRLSNSRSVLFTSALLAQLDRYCEANPIVPRYPKKMKDPENGGFLYDAETGKHRLDDAPRPCSRSKALRRAVYEYLHQPAKLDHKPHSVPTPPPTDESPIGAHSVSWTMPQGKRYVGDSQRLLALCHTHGVESSFVRRAVFMLTIAHLSPDKEEAARAIRDAWV